MNPTLQYAFDEAKIAGYQGNLNQFARTTGLTHELTGGNLVFDAVKFGWDKVAKGAVNNAIRAEKNTKFIKRKKNLTLKTLGELSKNWGTNMITLHFI